MSARGLALALLGALIGACAASAACSSDPPPGQGPLPGGAGGAGGSGGGATASSGSSVEDLALALVGPPDGTAFGRRWARVEVTFSSPSKSASLTLERGGEVVDSIAVEPAKEGTAALRLPLLRGATPFVVKLEEAGEGGQSITREGHLYGGIPVAATLDAMIAARDGSIARWGAGDPTLHASDMSVTSVAANNEVMFALDADGRVHRAPSGSMSPFELVAGLEDIVAIAPGGGHTLFLRADGRLFSVGANDLGQLATGDTESRSEAVEIAALQGIVAVTAGDEASFAVSEGGDLYAWGSNEYGQLGFGDQDTSPHVDPLIVPNLTGVEDVAAGRDHVLAVTEEGVVYAWGRGSSGQIGDGSSGILALKLKPVPIELPRRALTLAARANASFAVLEGGEVFGWGQNSLAQLGVGDTNPRNKPAACLVGAARAVGPGPVGGIALDSAGTLYAWGSNASGQLGLPLPPDGPERSSAPVAIEWP